MRWRAHHPFKSGARWVGRTHTSNLVNRRFHATGPNQLWVADMTYVPRWMVFLYLAVVIDV